MNRLIARAMALVAIAGGTILLGLASPATDATGRGLMAASAQEADAVEVVEMSMGDPEAPVTVIEYASFTCPHCKRFHTGPYHDLKADYIDTGKVRFIYREVYFDRYGLWAGMVARCGGQERYFGIAEMLYENQSDWARGEPSQIAGSLRKIGLSAGLSGEELDACMSDQAHAEALVATFQSTTEADGIRATPSFVIDGTLYSNMAWSEFSALLDAQLDAAN